MIVRNRLLNFGDNIIYQDNEAFLFSLDSVLLANFVNIKLSDKKIIDLCSGNGPVPMLMSFRTKAKIEGMEIQKYIYDMAVKSIEENKMNSQINMVNDDILNYKKYYEDGSFDVVTCNPPYFKYKEDSLINDNEFKTIARHEKKIKLEEVISVSSNLLKNGGTFAMVHRPDRFMEIINLMDKYNLEVKKIRFVYPKKDKESNMLLIEGTKNGKTGLKILPPLVVYNDNNEYIKEIKEMFGD